MITDRRAKPLRWRRTKATVFGARKSDRELWRGDLRFATVQRDGTWWAKVGDSNAGSKSRDMASAEAEAETWVRKMLAAERGEP